MKVATWNVAWRAPASLAGRTMRARLLDESPDVACLTEADAGFMGDEGYSISSGADYGYPKLADRRKVVLWSKYPWREVDQLGEAALPPGRFVAGTTETPLGDLLVIGVCIPWAAAHVSSGRRDRRRWEDHLAYLDGLGVYLDRQAGPFVLLGDFNQAVPRRTAPAAVFASLEREVLRRARLFTSGEFPGHGFAIDHVCGSASLHCTNAYGLSRFGDDSQALSDHFGIVVDMARAT